MVSDSESDAVAGTKRVPLQYASMNPHPASARVRARLKEELHARDISQRELADALSKLTGHTWTQSKVGKVLTGAVELKVDDVDAIAKVAHIYLSEAVRDRGLEFYAEMTPTELRMLEKMRQRPAVLHAIMLLLEMKPPDTISSREPKPRRGGPLKYAKIK